MSDFQTCKGFDAFGGLRSTPDAMQSKELLEEIGDLRFGALAT